MPPCYLVCLAYSAISGITRIAHFVEIGIIEAAVALRRAFVRDFGFDSGRNALTGTPK